MNFVASSIQNFLLSFEHPSNKRCQVYSNQNPKGEFSSQSTILIKYFIVLFSVVLFQEWEWNQLSSDIVDIWKNNEFNSVHIRKPQRGYLCYSGNWDNVD